MNENNITRLNYRGKEIILIATAHVSKASAQEVKEAIEIEKPDSICIELDKDRHESMLRPKAWENYDIVKIIKEKKVGLLLVNMILSSYQKRVASNLDTNVGQEMVQAMQSAKETNTNLVLADRNIQTTFIRIWRSHNFFDKTKLLFTIISSLFDDEKISEEELEKLKQEDMLQAALSDISKEFPKIAQTLIFERDQYLAYKIKTAPGNKIVAVLGAAHVPGIKEEIFKQQNIKELNRVPEKTFTSKIIGWIIPAIIIGLIGYSFIVSIQTGYAQLLNWIIWNSTLSALAAALVLAHPLSILTAFIVAPFTSLNPLLAAGWFAGLTEAYLRKPTVKDFQNINQDILSIKGFLKNRFLKTLLVVVFANLGSTLGTIISGLEIVKNFMDII